MTAMPTARVSVLLSALALIAVIALPADLPAQSTAGDVAIVVHPETPVDSMTLVDVRKVFRGERQYWAPSNLPVVLLVRAPVSRERDVVLRVIYQMSEPQFKQYWIARIFRAEATSGPKIVYSNDVANQLAGAIPGAVGFMPAGEVKPPLKIVRVDGKLPGEPGYLIR
jgi:ABC-type phosphate transport system substrate-binding protein